MGKEPEVTELPTGFRNTIITLQSASLNQVTAQIGEDFGDDGVVTVQFPEAVTLFTRFSEAVAADAYQMKHGGLTPEDEGWLEVSQMHKLFAGMTESEFVRSFLAVALMHNAVETLRRLQAMHGLGERKLFVTVEGTEEEVEADE